MKPREVSSHIVFDPQVCHGEPTFRGTRILVADVLEQVARGLTPTRIVKEWDGKISTKAIAEAVLMARSALLGGDRLRRRAPR